MESINIYNVFQMVTGYHRDYPLVLGT